jgi:hypothetical protein
VAALIRFETIWQDFRYAARQLKRNPGYAITAILTLALGIGASTAVFSVAYGVLIDPFPYKDVHTLATPRLCSPEWPRCGWRVYTPQQYNEIADRTDIFNGVTASTISNVVLTGGTEPQRLRGNYITPNTFDVLGVKPILGRATQESELPLLAGSLWRQQCDPGTHPQLRRASPHDYWNHAAAFSVARRGRLSARADDEHSRGPGTTQFRARGTLEAGRYRRAGGCRTEAHL